MDTVGPGNFKKWMYPHRIVYFEKRARGHLREWLGLQRSLRSITLYGNSCKLKFLLNSI